MNNDHACGWKNDHVVVLVQAVAGHAGGQAEHKFGYDVWLLVVRSWLAFVVVVTRYGGLDFGRHVVLWGGGAMTKNNGESKKILWMTQQ